jgi:hypothetical protein
MKPLNNFKKSLKEKVKAKINLIKKINSISINQLQKHSLHPLIYSLLIQPIILIIKIIPIITNINPNVVNNLSILNIKIIIKMKTYPPYKKINSINTPIILHILKLDPKPILKLDTHYLDKNLKNFSFLENLVTP